MFTGVEHLVPSLLDAHASDRAFGGCFPFGVLCACAAADPTDKHPGPPEGPIVRDGFKDRFGGLRQVDQATGILPGVGRRDGGLLYSRTELDPAVAEGCRLLERLVGTLVLSQRRKSDAELAQEVAAFRFSRREQRNGPHEQS